MLGKKKDFAEEKINSIFAEDVVIEGNITLKDAVRVDGTIKGDIVSKGSIFVGKTGKIEGSVQAANIMIAGSVQGNLNISQRIEAVSASKIKGDIVAKSLSIDENAHFEGRCTMNVNGKEAKEDKALKVADTVEA